jgi:Tfp pilus assembly protein PilW
LILCFGVPLVRRLCAEPSEWIEWPDEAFDLLDQLLQNSPDRRISAEHALRHPFICVSSQRQRESCVSEQHGENAMMMSGSEVKQASPAAAAAGKLEQEKSVVKREASMILAVSPSSACAQSSSSASASTTTGTSISQNTHPSHTPHTPQANIKTENNSTTKEEEEHKSNRTHACSDAGAVEIASTRANGHVNTACTSAVPASRKKKKARKNW